MATTEELKIDAQLKELALESITVIRDFLRSPTDKRETILALKASQVSLSNYTRHEQTQGAKEATTFMMARELAKNPEELAHYMKVAMPSSTVTKAIPGMAPAIGSVADKAWEATKK